MTGFAAHAGVRTVEHKSGAEVIEGRLLADRRGREKNPEQSNW